MLLEPVSDLVKIGSNQPLVKLGFESFVRYIFYFDIDC